LKSPSDQEYENAAPESVHLKTLPVDQNNPDEWVRLVNLEDNTRATILIHYYRAMIGRADIWRTRMDTTTNWAIGATAAVVSFAWGDSSSPHYMIHIAAFLTVTFLLLEARRLTFYHLWQQRAFLIERALIAPATRDPTSPSPTHASLEMLERELAPHLGSTVPNMSIGKAAARRLRRVYVYLFAAQLLAWFLKLAIHPEPLTSSSSWVSRAAVGPVPGLAVLVGSIIAFCVAALMALIMGPTQSAQHDHIEPTDSHPPR